MILSSSHTPWLPSHHKSIWPWQPTPWTQIPGTTDILAPCRTAKFPPHPGLAIFCLRASLDTDSADNTQATKSKPKSQLTTLNTVKSCLAVSSCQRQISVMPFQTTWEVTPRGVLLRHCRVSSLSCRPAEEVERVEAGVRCQTEAGVRWGAGTWFLCVRTYASDRFLLFKLRASK